MLSEYYTVKHRYPQSTHFQAEFNRRFVFHLPRTDVNHACASSTRVDGKYEHHRLGATGSEIEDASWCYDMAPLSALLALCEWNPPVTGNVIRCIVVFFVVGLNKLLNKQASWCERPWCSCEVPTVDYLEYCHIDVKIFTQYWYSMIKTQHMYISIFV